MRNLFVMNPVAGNAANSIINKDIINEKFNGQILDILDTKPNRQVVKDVRDYLNKYKDEDVRIYACGGDGTIHEVVNGMVGFDKAELAIIPTGTGNDFVKYYGGKDKFLDLDKMMNSTAKPADISKIEGASLDEPWYSINVINFGFDAIVGAMGNYYKENGYPEKAKAKGMSPYDYALKNDAMKHGRYNNTEVYADGEKLNEKQILLCTLAQGQFVGGQFHCAPKSDNTDGLIDVCLLKTMTLIGLGMIINTYTAGKHLDKKRNKIVYRRAKEIQIVAPKEIDVCVDGEMIKGSEFKVSCMPNAIKLVIPE